MYPPWGILYLAPRPCCWLMWWRGQALKTVWNCFGMVLESQEVQWLMKGRRVGCDVVSIILGVGIWLSVLLTLGVFLSPYDCLPDHMPHNHVIYMWSREVHVIYAIACYQMLLAIHRCYWWALLVWWRIDAFFAKHLLLVDHYFIHTVTCVHICVSSCPVMACNLCVSLLL